MNFCGPQKSAIYTSSLSLHSVQSALSFTHTTEPWDLPNVHRALIGIQHHWECTATQLGLPQTTVETAKHIYHDHDPKRCLKYVLDEWLKGNYDTQQLGHPSWRKVCEVTAEPAGGDNRALALEIAANVRFIDPPKG